MKDSNHPLSRRFMFLALGVAFCVAWIPPLSAGVLVERGQALEEAFPGAEFERVAVYLTKGQVDELEHAAGSRPSSRAAFLYRARRGGELVGTAYFDRHVVRTKAETVMVVVTVAGRIEKVEILAFDEPKDYLPPSRWLQQFDGRSLDAQLALKRGIRGLTGATLTSRSVTRAVKRALALHALLEQEDTVAEEEDAEVGDK